MEASASGRNTFAAYICFVAGQNAQKGSGSSVTEETNAAEKQPHQALHPVQSNAAQITMSAFSSAPISACRIAGSDVCGRCCGARCHWGGVAIFGADR